MLWQNKCKKYFKVLSKKIKEIKVSKERETGDISKRVNKKIIGVSKREKKQRKGNHSTKSKRKFPECPDRKGVVELQAGLTRITHVGVGILEL